MLPGTSLLSLSINKCKSTLDQTRIQVVNLLHDITVLMLTWC